MGSFEDNDGKHDRVMVACVADEVLMLTSPAKFYSVDRVHLINYIKGPKEGDRGSRERYELFSDIYRTVYDSFEKAGIRIEEHRDRATYSFEDMAAVLFDILSEEKARGSTVYVSVTGGTMVYAAATSLITMMFDNAHLFNVGVMPDDHTVSDYRQKRENLTYEGELVGSAKKVIEKPFLVKPIPMKQPDRRLLCGLRILESIPLAKRSNTNVIRNLMRNGLWVIPSEDPDTTSYAMEDHDTFTLADPGKRDSYKKLQNKEGVQYQRVFVDKWKALGWVDKDDTVSRTKYYITDAGAMYLHVFCPKSVFDFGPEDAVYQKKRSQ